MKRLRNNRIILIILPLTAVLSLFALDTEYYFRLNIIDGDQKQYFHYHVEKGDLIILSESPFIPFLYKGGNPIRWRMETDGSILVNENKIGLKIEGSNEDLLSENQLTEVILLEKRQQLENRVIEAIRSQTFRRILLSLRGFYGTADELKKILAFKERIIFLSLRDGKFENIDDDFNLPLMFYLDLNNCQFDGRDLSRLITGSPIVTLDMGETRISNQVLYLLTDQLHLKKLVLEGATIDDSSMEIIGELKNLVSLNIASTRVTDIGMSNLKKLRFLRSLDISYNKITECSMEELTILTFLKELNMKGLKFTRRQKELDDITDHNFLEVINLSFSNINSYGLSILSECPRIRALDLTSTNLSDSDIKPLRDMKMLEDLNLAGNPIFGDGIKYIRNLPNLKILDLTATRLKAGPMQQYFGDMYRLEQLYLGGTGFDDQGLSYLREFQNLSILDLSGTNVTGRSMDFLLGIPGLRTVFLTGSKYTAYDIDTLRKKSPLLNVIYEE